MSSVKRHPVDCADLLLYAEGELAGSAAGRTHSHIVGCPGCQAELEKLQGEIRTLARFRNDFGCLVPAPPSPWGPLDVQIESWEKRWRIRCMLESLGAMLRPRYGLAAMAAMLLLIVCFVMLPHETVSANELLARAVAAQGKRLYGVQGRLIHERLQIHRRSVAYSQAKDETIIYESWQDSAHNRFQETSSSMEMTNELARIYQANHLDWRSPLSVEAYEKWQSALPEKHDSIARSGSAELTLTTLVGKKAQGDAIGRAQLVVSANDWLPRAVHLWLRDREYEIREVSSELLSPPQIDPFLPDAPAALWPLAATMNAATPQETSLTHIGHVSAPTLAPALPIGQTGNQNVVPLTQAMVLGSASGPVVASGNGAGNRSTSLQNLPDAPSHAYVSRVLTSDLAGEPTVLDSSAVSAPVRDRKTGVTLTYRWNSAQRPLSGLGPEPMPAEPVQPFEIRHDPFKLFKSTTVAVNTPQQQRPADCSPLRTLGARLGILKQKKATPAPSFKPGD